MDATFVDALQVPAVLSTLRKMQHDSDSSLRTLNAYYRRHRFHAKRPALHASEEEALSDVLATVVEQALGGLVFYVGVRSAYVIGGVLAGQVAQCLISINMMTAPKSQFINPGKLFRGVSGRTGGRNLDFLSPSFSTALAFELGRLGEITGYRERLPQKYQAEHSYERCTLQPSSLLSFVSLPRPDMGYGALSPS